MDKYCRDPCLEPNGPCARNAECRTTSHRAVCRCPVGWVGNPHEECYTCESMGGEPSFRSLSV